MKLKINKVNPKAGTLKLTNNAVWNNAKAVSRKMIAFVLMLGLTLTNMAFMQEDDSLGKGTNLQGGATATNINKADTCCAAEKGKTAVIGRKAVKLVLPSVETVRKADSEVFANLYASMVEQSNYFSMQMLNRADAEIGTNFETEVNYEVSIPANSSLNKSDEAVNASFTAENIGIGQNASKMVQKADEDMNSLFVAEIIGVNMPTKALAAADQEINSNFEAENSFRISGPSTESIVKADKEINSNIYKDTISKGVAKTSKKGRK
jgi:hypothetical protein